MGDIQGPHPLDFMFPLPSLPLQRAFLMPLHFSIISIYSTLFHSRTSQSSLTPNYRDVLLKKLLREPFSIVS